MFGFEPTAEQNMLVEAVRRYAKNDLRAAAHEADESGELPRELIEKGWELGVLQASVPEEYGGFGERSAVTGALAAEELAWGDLSGALAIMAPGAYALSVLLSGSEDQKSKLIPAVIEGDWKPYAAAFMEPDYDFYAGEMRTTAVASNGDYLITGHKARVAFGDRARTLLTFARVEGQIEAFAVPTDTVGLQVGEREALLGIQALPTFPVTYKNVRVPASARLKGMDPFKILSSFDAAIGALSVGLSRAAYEYALDYAKDREAFGSPIAQKQAIAFMLAEMATEIDGARLMVWEAAWEIDQSKDASRTAFLARTNAAETAMMVTDRAVQILGGHKALVDTPGFVIVWATIDPEAGRKGIRSFVVEAGTAGCTVTKLEKKLGIRCSDTAAIVLQDCRVPLENMLGTVEQVKKTTEGYKGVLRTFEATRPLVGASALGIARAALEFLKGKLAEGGIEIRYGLPLSRMTNLEAEVVELEAMLRSAWLLTLRAVWMVDNKIAINAESSMSKINAGDAVVKITQKAVELLGPMGYSREHLLEKWFRDAKINDLYEGTGQINRLIVARRILGYSRHELS